MRLLKAGICALLIVPLVSSCNAFQEGFEEGLNSADYTEEMKTSFIAGCQQAAEKERDVTSARNYCECTFDRISSTIPVEEYTKLDMGQEMSAEAKEKLNVAVTQCGGSASAL
jgi:hypothetical protein